MDKYILLPIKSSDNIITHIQVCKYTRASCGLISGGLSLVKQVEAHQSYQIHDANDLTQSFTISIEELLAIPDTDMIAHLLLTYTPITQRDVDIATITKLNAVWGKSKTPPNSPASSEENDYTGVL